ncbi:MAG: PorV/PorQ family protein [Gemmatimonadaceae bacterium]|nr:PorV/PorQ family protein [Gemmatimonadaceae bacterium]
MRRRRSGNVGAACVAALALLLAPALRAQRGLSREGALFLLVPIGARPVAMGQAVVASPDIGGEAVWWNPAALASLTRREAGFHFGQTLVANSLAGDFVLPAGRAGTVAFSAHLLDYGAQEFTDQIGSLGTLLPRSLAAAATYGAGFGRDVDAGLSYKLVQSRLDCTGPCGDVSTFNASTSALDAGLRVRVRSVPGLTLGAAVRNLGLRLQVNDNSQADPLPTRLHLGAQLPIRAVSARDTSVAAIVAAELVAAVPFAAPQLRVGTELSYQHDYFLRAGYATGTGDATGASFGMGFRRGGLAIEFARVLGGFSADAGQPPTYLSLRLQF